MVLSDKIVIVSGLPRSGTSMMMKILEIGGIEVLTDGLRTADKNNPNGYYELEMVKSLKDGDLGWLATALGKSIKVLSALIPHLPSNYQYKIIFMERDLKEVLASQRKMLVRLGKPDDHISDEYIADIFQNHLAIVKTWLANQPNIEVVYINYNELIKDPTDPIRIISDFLGGNLDIGAMSSVVNPDLYRERN